MTTLPTRWLILSALARAEGLAMRGVDVAASAGLDPATARMGLLTACEAGQVERHETVRKRRGREPVRRVVGYSITEEGLRALDLARREARLWLEGGPQVDA